MKKHIFRFTALLCTALLGLTACTIDDPVAGPIIGGDQPDPGPGEGTPSNAQIAIDGDFSDWAALDKADIFERHRPTPQRTSPAR